MRSPMLRMLAAATVALAACGGGDDGGSFSPSVANVAGSYHAISFTLTSGVGTTDLLALGSSVTITLGTDGTTTGRLLVPGGGEGGGDLDEDLTGTWSLQGSTVTFSQTNGTLIQGAPFTATLDHLTGEGEFGGSTIRLVLAKDT